MLPVKSKVWANDERDLCEEFGSTSRGKAWCGTWVMLREVVGLYELQPAVKSTLGVIGRLLELPSSESEKSNSEDTWHWVT